MKMTTISSSDSSSTRMEKCNTMTKEYVKSRLPILRWLPSYKRKYIVSDIVAGITVFLTAIPQSMAYALIAGVSPEYGLYSSIVGPFIYVLFGSCRQMTIGPTAIIQLLTYETCGNNFPSCVILMGFYAGVLQIIMGLLHVGAVCSLISEPVTIGFTAGAAVTVISAQVKSFFGLSGEKGRGFIGTWIANFDNIKTVQLGDTLVGVFSVLILVTLKYSSILTKSLETTSKAVKHMQKIIWFFSISRNAFIILLGSIVAFCLVNPPFQLTGSVKSGLPPFGVPQFVLPIYENSTATNATMSYWQTWGKLRTTPLSVAFISILQNVAIAKAFGSGQSIDATQEMLALGITHIVASFFSAIPTSGSFTRSAVNDASGVKSPFGGICTGILILFALAFLTPMFYFIPKASLAAVIICAVFSMIEYEALPKMWRISKWDLLSCLATFFSSLIVGMEFGILIGLAVSILLYLLQPLRPNIDIELFADEDQVSYLTITPELGLNFPSVDHIRTYINKMLLLHEECQVLAINLSKMSSLDFTGANAFNSLVNGVRKTGKQLVFYNCIDEDEWSNILLTVGLTNPPFYKDLENVKLFAKEVRRKQLQDKKDQSPELETLITLREDSSSQNPQA